MYIYIERPNGKLDSLNFRRTLKLDIYNDDFEKLRQSRWTSICNQVGFQKSHECHGDCHVLKMDWQGFMSQSLAIKQSVATSQRTETYVNE